MAKRNLPDEKNPDPTPVAGGVCMQLQHQLQLQLQLQQQQQQLQIQQQHHQEEWGELYKLDATESYSTEDDYSDFSDEDDFDDDDVYADVYANANANANANADADDARGYLRVEIENQGENNKNKINIFPKSSNTNIRRFGSTAQLNLSNHHNHKANGSSGSGTCTNTTGGGAKPEEHFARAESEPTLLPSSNRGLPAFLANRIRNAELVVGDARSCSAHTIAQHGHTHVHVHVQPTVGPATKALQQNQQEQEDPRQLYAQILEKHGVCSSVRKSEDLGDFFIPMGESNVTGYTMDKVTAVRGEDIEALRAMHKKGQTLQVCNQFGESIIHSACRRGLSNVLGFLVDEAHVSLAVTDDYGKTPAHDACWTIKPNFEVVKIVVASCPDLMLVADKRGSTPLDYTQKSLWSDWCAFLRKNEDMLIPKRLGRGDASSSIGSSSNGTNSGNGNGNDTVVDVDVDIDEKKDD